MEIIPVRYEKIAHCLPVQRGNVSLANLSVLNAILYVAENDCNWRRLPKCFGNWHTYLYVNDPLVQQRRARSCIRGVAVSAGRAYQS